MYQNLPFHQLASELRSKSSSQINLIEDQYFSYYTASHARILIKSLAQILYCSGIKRIYLPAYICSSIVTALSSHLELIFYNVSPAFIPRSPLKFSPETAIYFVFTNSSESFKALKKLDFPKNKLLVDVTFVPPSTPLHPYLSDCHIISSLSKLNHAIKVGVYRTPRLPMPPIVLGFNSILPLPEKHISLLTVKLLFTYFVKFFIVINPYFAKLVYGKSLHCLDRKQSAHVLKTAFRYGNKWAYYLPKIDHDSFPSLLVLKFKQKSYLYQLLWPENIRHSAFLVYKPFLP